MIRYKIDVMSSLKDKGFSRTRLRNSKLLSESTMSKFQHYDTNLTLNSINAVCNLLHCQISDVVEYIPDSTDNTDKE